VKSGADIPTDWRVCGEYELADLRICITDVHGFIRIFFTDLRGCIADLRICVRICGAIIRNFMICIRTCEAVYGITDIYYGAIYSLYGLCRSVWLCIGKRLSGLKFKKTVCMN